MTRTRQLLACIGLVAALGGSLRAQSAVPAPDAWTLARKHADVLRFSTLFTAQDVRRFLSTPEGLAKALQWCRDTAVTHVYLESFRGGYTADKQTLLAAKKAFADAGLLVSGCITPTGLGRKSVDGWEFPCFTEIASQKKLQEAFEYAAALFDEIMIDDFFATKCVCEDCIKARGDKSWSEYRCELLVDISRRCVLEPARKVNPKVQIIIKYPQWYEEFHERGYEVVRQSAMFEKTWVGTETRDPDSQQWGRKAQYEAYFIMRWLGEIGGEKCGGGWFDPYGTSPPTYLEQARQTVLAGAREAVLFCYGSLQDRGGAENVKALRPELPGLFELARLVHGQPARGIHAPRPPNSSPGGNPFIYDFVGLLGLPLAPTATLRTDVPSAFLPAQIIKDPEAPVKVAALLKAGTPLLVTSQLVEKLPGGLDKSAGKVEVLDVPKDAWDLMKLPPERLTALRRHLLSPLGVAFDAPSRVGLYLFGEDLAVVENFNDQAVTTKVSLKDRAPVKIALSLSPDGTPATLDAGALRLPPRTLAVVTFAGER